MANWMGGRRALAEYTAVSEVERERRKAEDRRRRTAEESMAERERDRVVQQPRGALSRVIQPAEQQQQHRRGRGRRGGEETVMMDRLRTAERLPEHRDRDDRYRVEDRDRDRERGYGRESRGRRRRGAEGERRGAAADRREHYGRVEDRYETRQPRAKKRWIEEESDGSWDDGEVRDRGNGRYRSGARGWENFEYGDIGADYGGAVMHRRTRRSRSRSPIPQAHRRAEDDEWPHPSASYDYHLQRRHYSSGVTAKRDAIGRDDRRLVDILPVPAPMNAYQRAQIRKQQQEQRQRLMADEQSRLESTQRARENATRQTFLSQRQRSPPFVFDPPPHLSLPAMPPRRAQLQVRRRTSPPMHPAFALRPARQADLQFEHSGADRREDMAVRAVQRAPNRPALDASTLRPAFLTPSPPPTPMILARPSAQRMADNALWPAPTHEPRLHALFPARTSAAFSSALVPWTSQSAFTVPHIRLPPAPQRPVPLRPPDVKASFGRSFVATSAAIDLSSSPLSPAIFRLEPAPHMRTAGHDGGHQAVRAKAKERAAGGTQNDNGEREAGRTEVGERSSSINDGQTREQKQSDQSHTAPKQNESSVEPQAKPCTNLEVVERRPVEPIVQSSADIERALSNCEAAPDAARERVEHTEHSQQQPVSPLIEVDMEGGEEKQAEEETRVQSEADSAVSSHYAFVGPARYDGIAVVRQLLVDNNIHLVDFDDVRCNIAFLEIDYTPAQLSMQPIERSKEDDICFYDMQYIRDTAVGTVKELTEYRLSKPSERCSVAY